MIFRHLLNMRSHPTWVRGLKLKKCQTHYCHNVAPYVGAWIETADTAVTAAPSGSHPTWVRGLKHPDTSGIRSLAESHPTWVRGLKLLNLTSYRPSLRRTLRGCVD